MRVSLGTKILGSFTIIVSLSLVLAVGSGNRLTRVRYDEFANIRDLNRARSIAQSLGEWTEAASEGREVPPPPLGGSMLPMSPQPVPYNDRMGRMMGDMMRGRGDWDRETVGLDRLVITDLDGRVLWDNFGYGRDNLAPDERQSVVLRNRGRDVGYLYLGRMIPEGSRPPELSLMRSVGAATWAVAGLVFLLAMVLGTVLTRHIIRPVKALNRAAGEVESGKFDTRVPERRRDEMGDLARSFNSMTTSLESADRQRRRLVADSAHELRTPVSLIRTRIEMMEEGVYPMDGENLAALSEEAERLSRLVDELKLLSELESPVFSLDTERTELGKLLEEAVSAAEPLAHREGLKIDAVATESLYLSIDRHHIHRLISNLLSNALRHARNTVRVSLSHLDGFAVIAVEDDGPGIPEDQRDKVFQRYFRGDASRNRTSGGSGLGLAICLEIARAHGGTLKAGVAETLGGAKFLLSLPMV